MKHVWIIEMLVRDNIRHEWQPTGGGGLSRDQARREMVRWQHRNASERFRVCRYVREVVGCTT